MEDIARTINNMWNIRPTTATTMKKEKNNSKKTISAIDNVALAIWRFKASCNVLAKLVNKQLFEDSRDWYWIGEKPGGSCDFGDTDFLTPEEMVLVLEHRLTYDEYVEWRDANIAYIERKGFINLKSWIMGCRHDMLADKPTYPDHNKEGHQEQSNNQEQL